MTVSAPRSERILFLCKTFSYGFGGTPESVLLAAQRLQTRGLGCDVYASGVLTRDAGQLMDLPSMPETRAAAAIDFRDYTCVLIAGAWIPSALRTAIAARLRGARLIYAPKGHLCRADFSGRLGVLKTIYFLSVEIWVVLLSHHVIFTSELEWRGTGVFKPVFDRKAVVVPELTHDAWNTSERRTTSGASSLRKFGFIGQMSKRKGLTELVQGFLAFCENHPASGASLTIAGTALPRFEADFEAMRMMSQTHPFGDRIVCLGQVGGAARRAFYADMDVVVVPSHFESFGLVPLEALSHGCAVLLGPDIGVREFLLETPCVRYLAAITPAAIASALSDLSTAWPRLAEARRAVAGAPLTRIVAEDVAQTLACLVTNRTARTAARRTRRRKTDS